MIDIKDFQLSLDDLDLSLSKFSDDGSVLTVGVHEDDNAREDDSKTTNADIGAYNQFGGTINHPGGTSYGYKTENDAKRGKVRFMKSGQGYMQLGVTEPHTITIPARPFLDIGVMNGVDEYDQALNEREHEDLQDALKTIGVFAQGAVRSYMTDLQDPPNAPSTIKKKGSSNPLIDTGELRSSITWVVSKETITEGL